MISFDEAVAFLLSKLADAVGPLLGFASAWLLFVLQEHRKQRVAVQSTRQSLIAELKLLESVLSLTVVRCAVQSGIVDQGVREFRWFLKEGVERNIVQELAPNMVESREKVLLYSDSEIAKLVAVFRHGNQAGELPITITQSALAAPTSAKLSAAEVKTLIEVNWQSIMLATDVRTMNECLRLTFTVSDETNHQIVKENHASSLRMYGRRASFMLDRVRAALKALGAGASEAKN